MRREERADETAGKKTCFLSGSSLLLQEERRSPLNTLFLKNPSAIPGRVRGRQATTLQYRRITLRNRSIY